MHSAEEPDSDTSFEAHCPSRLVVTDQPPSWTGLIRQIAELEELLNELVEQAADPFTLGAVERIRILLEEKRRAVRAIDVA